MLTKETRLSKLNEACKGETHCIFMLQRGPAKAEISAFVLAVKGDYIQIKRTAPIRAHEKVHAERIPLDCIVGIIEDREAPSA